MAKTNNKLYYGWIVAAACFCLQGGILGIISNLRGLFYDPVCTSLGFVLGDFTMYTTFYGIATIIAIPVATKVIPKCNLPVTVALCCTLNGAAQFIQGYFTQLWQWYAVAVVQGALHAFIYSLVVSVVINNWFIKKKGIVFAVVGTASGFVGAVLNVVCENIIQTYGWQTAYRFTGILLFVMMAPMALTLRRKPEDMGLKPYGYDPNATDGSASLKPRGVMSSAALRSPALWYLLIGVALMCFMTCCNQFMKNYALNLGYPSTIGATFVSIALVGNVVIKLILGSINDKWGYQWGIYTGDAMSLAGALLLLVNSTPTLYLASFLFGAPMALTSVCIPVWTSSVFGNIDYVKIYSWVMLINGVCSSANYSLVGSLISAAGYGAFVVFSIVCGILSGVFAILSVKSSKKLVFVEGE